MAQKVRKAVIPAAGLGLGFCHRLKRCLEMLPIVDKPVIQIVVEVWLRQELRTLLL